MKKIFPFLLVFIIIAIVALPAFAQTEPIPIGVGPGDGDGHDTPIGGMAVLAALGGGYAIKKLRDGKRQT